MSKTIVRAYGSVSDPGPSRDLNEDAVIAVPAHKLFGVADGFGGTGIGDVAATKTLEDVKYFVENGLGDSEVTLPFIYRTYLSASANLIFNALLYANERLCAENKSKPLNLRAGASLLFAFFSGDHMTLAHAGSCAAYLVRRGRAMQIAKPRSFNAVKGVFPGSWNGKWAFPLMALGIAKDIEPEIIELKIQRGDLLMLATDGVHGRLTDEDFSQSYSMLSEKTPLDILIHKENQRLITTANQKGNHDNQAVITMVCA
ncbi:MAG TPA: serine/threonine-protein phosphatase [Oligoflexia bacterium]|nr:serine/threonine-protein phosphatase [Oligoflexia bacterium]